MRYLKSHEKDSLKIISGLISAILLFIFFDEILVFSNSNIEAISDNPKIKILFLSGAFIPYLLITTGIQGGWSMIRFLSHKKRKINQRNLLETELDKVRNGLISCKRKLELKQTEFNGQVHSADKRVSSLRGNDNHFSASKHQASQQIISLKGIYQSNIADVKSELKRRIKDVDSAKWAFKNANKLAKEGLKNFKNLQ